MNNKLGNTFGDKIDKEDTIPAQVKDAVTRYLDIDTIDVDTCSVGSEIYDLILIGKKNDWEEVWLSWSCEETWNAYNFPSKTRFAEQLRLEWRQKVFILSLYDWIVSFSDSLQFEIFTLEEKIIADYIRKKFPGRDWAWFFPRRVSEVMHQ